jgi:hypothetical protein
LIPAFLSLNHYYYDPVYAKSSDWRVLADYLEANAAPDDVIVQNDPDPTLAYYYAGPSRRVVLPHRSAVDQVGNLQVKPVVTGRALQELLGQHPRLWLIPHRSAWDPEGFVETWLQRRALKVQEEQVDVFRIVVYEDEDSPAPEIAYPMQSTVGDRIEFLGYDLTEGGGCRFQPGIGAKERLEKFNVESCLLLFTLYWESLVRVEADYTVFVHLLDPDGEILAQQDSRPQGGGFPTQEWLPGDLITDEYTLVLPADTQPGIYSVEVGMYRLDTLQRPAAFDQNGARWSDDAIRLGQKIEVVP